MNLVGSVGVRFTIRAIYGSFPLTATPCSKTILPRRGRLTESLSSPPALRLVLRFFARLRSALGRGAARRRVIDTEHRKRLLVELAAWLDAFRLLEFRQALRRRG